MNLWPLRALASNVLFACAPGSVPVTVTRKDASPIATTGIWETSRDEGQPFGTAFRKAASRRLMALPVADVGAVLNNGDAVSAPLEQGATPVAWTIDGHADPSTPEVVRVFLIRA